MSDHWRSLAEDIGADVTEPEEDTDRAAKQADESRPAQANRTPRKRAAPKPKNHWQKIAGALGISFHRSEPEEEATDTEETVAAESEKSGNATSDSATADAEPAATTSEAVEDTVAEDKPSAFGFDVESASFGEPVDDRPDTLNTANRQVLAGAGDVEAEAVDRSTRSSCNEATHAYDPEHAKRELAALFADPADASAPVADVEFSTDTAGPSDESASSFSIEEETAQFGALPASDAQDEIVEEQGEKTGARHPRRRRGARRRRKDEQPTTIGREPDRSTSTDPDANVATTPDDADVSAPSTRDTDEGSDEGRARRGHRKIPSWQDAVGAIVETNLNSRRNSPSPEANQGSRRRRGSGRGRRRPPQKR